MDVISYALSKKIAASAVSGVSSMSVDGTTLNIDTNDGQRLQMTFPKPRDGVSVTDIDVNANNQIVFTMSDGTEFISGKIPIVKGDAGFSPTITENADNTDKIYKLDITTADSTFTTPNLKGADGQGGTGSGEENVIESIKVNGVVQTVADDKSVDITVPTVDVDKNYVDTELAKKANSSDIPSLDGYAKTSEIPSKVSALENDSNYLSSIPEEYVTDTELSAKGYLTEHQDISGKVDKVEGKSLISDTEIERLASVDNYDDTDIRTELSNINTSLDGKLNKTFTGDDVTNKVLSTDENGNVVLKNSSGTAGKSAYEIAVDNGFVGTETEWLESLKGSDGAKGDNGTTPHIDSITKNWFIGDVDTGVLAQGADGKDGKDGKSISTITKDDNDNLIVTFTDGSTQNIGKLSVDIQGDFLTSDGIGNLRYYNSHFQYYDESSSTWVDTSVTPSNVYIMNMTPQEMKSIFGVYDVDLGKYKLRFEEPDDTIIDGQVACIVEKVIIRRKLGSVPISETDGDLVLEIKRKNFGSYKNEYFVDTTLSPSDGDVYYYKAFPMSTTGFYNYSDLNETDGIKCKDYNLYGFKLDQNESNPASMITYLSDCDNKYYKSAYMDYSSDTFNYGNWGDVWFIKNLKPCMLKYDGTVDYELNPNDYTKKLDGTASDVANASYGGNAMVGIPKVYWKIVDNGDNTANIYICDKKIDDDFVCWSHIDNNGNEIDYCYMPIYNGSNVNSVLRSISGKAPMVSQTATTEITYAKENNTGSDVIWYTELFNDRMLINLLLLLIGKSTDTQTVFGTGNNNSHVSASNTGVKNTGTMNTKGLFWGNQDNKSGVKVFGIEHWYGNIWRHIGGWINDKGTQKIKMTYGQSDGSTSDGYNETGSGYISIGGATPSGTSGGYISKILITDNGLMPTIVSGSATTYYCDGFWFNNSQVDYALVGGGSANASRVGALCSGLSHAISVAYWGIGAALSCKPLATT